MEKVLKGLCITPDVNQIEDFSFNDYIPEEWEPFILSNGRILETPGKPHKTVIFDFNGGDYAFNGYVRGFIYPDGKYLATMHYVPEARLKAEKLNGNYKLTKDGIELKGIWYDSEEKKVGFLIKLTYLNSLDEESAARKKLKQAAPSEHLSDTFKGVLTADLFKSLSEKGNKLKLKGRKGIYDHYQHIIDLKLKPNSFDDLLIAMSVAYSWMPTMLDIYLPDKSEANHLLKAIHGLGSITKLKQFEEKEKDIEQWLSQLAEVINHSIVGVSKTLHIFYPNTIPIIDKRVLVGWDKTFKKHYRKQPDLKLTATIPTEVNRMVRVYMRYWKLLLSWNYNIENNDIRKLEEPFYWIGKQ